MQTMGPIGVFDSGYGGLTILKEIVSLLPQYDYIYLGDNARSPYGTRSFETVYHYTLESVNWLFHQNCPLVILACNTASAKALRTIQQNNLPLIQPHNRVLGVIRPTAEIIGNYTQTNQVGILATNGTVQSQSYILEVKKFFPKVQVHQEACPMWVPLIENNEHNNEGADYFVKKHLNHLLSFHPDIDVILLGCTHYPLLLKKIEQHLSKQVKIISQGEIVAASLVDYLNRHPEMEIRCSKNSQVQFFTTDSAEDFDNHGAMFYSRPVKSVHIHL